MNCKSSVSDQSSTSAVAATRATAAGLAVSTLFTGQAAADTPADPTTLQTVEITGKVQDYHGHPEIIINTATQVKMLDTADKETKGEKTEKPEKKTE